MHFLLMYDLAPDHLERRDAYRDEHLTKAWAAHERGELLLGGALVDPMDQAILCFVGDSPAVAEEFARNDPYVVSGLVKRWTVRRWNTVAGALASTPVHPAK